MAYSRPSGRHHGSSRRGDEIEMTERVGQRPSVRTDFGYHDQGTPSPQPMPMMRLNPLVAAEQRSLSVSSTASTAVSSVVQRTWARSSGDVINQLEKALGREEVNDARPEMAYRRMETLKEMPEPLRYKRQALHRIDQDAYTDAGQGQISWFAMTKFLAARSYQNTVGLAIERGDYYSLWAEDIKSIEGTHGSGVGTYFRFLRFLLGINVLTGFISTCFIFVPGLLGRFYVNGTRVEDPYANHEKLYFGDFFTGGGWMANTELFYGYYPPGEINAFEADSITYSMQDGYFYTMLTCYIVAVVVTSVSMARSYRSNFIDTEAGGLKNDFCSRVFASWDCAIIGQKASTEKSEAIANQFKERLEKNNLDNSMGMERYLVMLAVNLVAFVAIVGTGYLTDVMIREIATAISQSTSSNDNTLLLALPAAISALMLVLPRAFSFISRFEGYRAPRHRVYITLVRTFLLEAAILGVLLYNTYKTKESDDEESTPSFSCFETGMGQEMYRLSIMFLLMLVLLPFLFETGHMLLYSKAKIKGVGVPRFDIAGNTVLLIYAQTVIWIGHYFSPLLPIVFALILFITFYVKKFSVNMNCRMSRSAFRAAQSKTIFLVTAFVSLIGAVVSTIFVMTNVPPSTSCGPFSNLGGATVFSLWDVTFFIFEPAIVTGIVILLCVAIYYARSMALARQSMVNVLKRRIQSEGKDKVFLIEMMKKVRKAKEAEGGANGDGDASSVAERRAARRPAGSSFRRPRPTN